MLFRIEKGQYPPKTTITKETPGNNVNTPIAVLALRVEYQPHRVDQSFRFYSGEQSFLKRSIRYANSTGF